jgi:hypothetical protein
VASRQEACAGRRIDKPFARAAHYPERPGSRNGATDTVHEQVMVNTTMEQWQWLLDAIDTDAMKRHPKRSCRIAG